jgi:hypothetical protein
MLVVNPKYKPVMSKQVKPVKMETDYTSSVVQGKGINELVEKVKALKVKENHKKRNVDNKISFE